MNGFYMNYKVELKWVKMNDSFWFSWESLIYQVSKIFRQTNISYLLMRTFKVVIIAKM